MASRWTVANATSYAYVVLKRNISRQQTSTYVFIDRYICICCIRVLLGAVRICVGRWYHECTIQVDLDLIEERMKPVIHRTHGIASTKVGSIEACHLRLNVQHRVGEIQVIVSDPGIMNYIYVIGVTEISLYLTT